MPKLTIDGREVEAPPGATILQTVLSQGRVVPHYCYHPGLSIAGNCRMCLVEVEKAPKLVIGCATVVTEGMVVRTESEPVKKARAAMMEFFLLNHPLDCPICDQAGECKLQDYAVEHGRGYSRSVERRPAFNKAVDIGPHVMLDQAIAPSSGWRRAGPSATTTRGTWLTSARWGPSPSRSSASRPASGT